MATVATLTFDLIANSATLRSDLAKASKQTESWATKTREATNAAGRAFVGASTVGVGALAAIYTKTSQAADQLGKFSDKVGEAPERIQGLQRAAQLTGVSVDTANMALQRMVRRVAEAGNGTGEAVKALAELNLNAEELAQQSPADQFAQIADAMNGVSNQGDRVRLAMKLFDSEGVSLVNTLKLGSEGLKEQEAEIKKYGLALTRVDIAKIEASNDAWFKAGEVTKGFGNQLATQVSPLVEALANDFLDASAEAGGFGSLATKAIDAVAGGIGVMADGLHGIEVLWKVIQKGALFAVSEILSALAAADRGVSAFLDKIPGIESKPSEALANIASDFEATFQGVSKELDALLLEPIPSEKIKTWVNDVTEKANAAAIEAAANTSGAGGNLAQNIATQTATGATEQTDSTATDSATEDRQAQLQSDFEAIQQSLLSEEQLLADSYARRQQTIAEFGALGGENQIAANQAAISLAEEYNNELLALEQVAADERSRIEEQHQAVVTSQRAAALNAAFGFAKALAGNSKKAALAVLGVETALKVGMALQNTAVAATRAVAELGPVAGPPAAASITGWGYAQAAFIAAQGVLKAASSSGGSGSPALAVSGGSSSGGFSSPAPVQNTSPGETGNKVTLVFNGPVGTTAEQFADELKDLIDNGLILVESDTDNALALAG